MTSQTNDQNLNSGPEELALALSAAFSNPAVRDQLNNLLAFAQSIGEGEPPTSIEFPAEARIMFAEKAQVDGCLILHTDTGQSFDIQIRQRAG